MTAVLRSVELRNKWEAVGISPIDNGAFLFGAQWKRMIFFKSAAVQKQRRNGR
jgi:hypothetical protein